MSEPTTCAGLAHHPGREDQGSATRPRARRIGLIRSASGSRRGVQWCSRCGVHVGGAPEVSDSVPSSMIRSRPRDQAYSGGTPQLEERPAARLRTRQTRSGARARLGRPRRPGVRGPRRAPPRPPWSTPAGSSLFVEHLATRPRARGLSTGSVTPNEVGQRGGASMRGSRRRCPRGCNSAPDSMIRSRSARPSIFRGYPTVGGATSGAPADASTRRSLVGWGVDRNLFVVWSNRVSVFVGREPIGQ